MNYFPLAITIGIVFSDDIIQITKADVSESKLKREFGCTPTEEFKLIQQSSKSGFVENVCLSTPIKL